jgi:hypothetical protein
LDIHNRDVKLEVSKESRNDIFRPDEESLAYLEQENILHKDGPKFVEEQLTRDLTAVDLVLIAAHLHQIWGGVPDEQREEFMRPFVLALTKDKDVNWLLVTNGMMWRCKNEFLRFKTQEKALLYMQGLLD